jgi:hypothetical protein
MQVLEGQATRAVGHRPAIHHELSPSDTINCRYDTDGAPMSEAQIRHTVHEHDHPDDPDHTGHGHPHTHPHGEGHHEIAGNAAHHEHEHEHNHPEDPDHRDHQHPHAHLHGPEHHS